MSFQRAPTTTQKLKIIFRGETKRIPTASSYDHLCKLALTAFSEPLIQESKTRKFKFYYLDEDHELISISSQADFDFAISLENPGSMRLIVEFDQASARSYLMEHLESTQSMTTLIRRPSMDDSQMFDRQSTISQNQNLRMSQIGIAFNDFDNQMEAPMTQRQPYHQPLEMSIQEPGIQMPNKNDMEKLLFKAFKDTTTNTVPLMTQATSTQATTKMTEKSSGEEKSKKRDSSSDSSSEGLENALNGEKVTCFKCKGTKLNKKQNPCRKCEGTGFFSGFPQEVTENIREQVNSYLKTQGNFQGLFDEYVNTRQNAQDAQVHENLICDGCDAAPIRGIRYMCSVCNNYDLCQGCEAKGQHKEHPMLKIRKAKQAPARIVCQYNNMNQSSYNSCNSEMKLHQQQNNQFPKCAPSNATCQKEKHLARFVKDSHGDGLRVVAGTVFDCSWTFRNTGKTAWPQCTELIRTSGDELVMSSRPAIVPANMSVGSEQEHTFCISHVAPTQPGRYTIFFRLQHKEMRFGQKVWADILVTEAAPVAEKQQVKEVEPVIKTEAPSMMPFPYGTNDQVPKMVPQVPIQEERVEATAPVTVVVKPEPFMMTPRQQFMDFMEQNKLDTEMKNKMATLFEFGFVDYAVNLEHLQKNKGDLEATAAFLSDQLLAKSTY